MRAVMLTLLIFLASFSGCFGNPPEDVEAKLSIDPIEQAVRGQIMTIHVESNVEWTVNRSAGLFFIDDDGVFRDDSEMAFTPDIEDFEILVLDSERADIELIITAGEESENMTMQLIDSDEMMLVDGRRAFDTIDMLTTDWNNRWCASADLHGGGATYEAAAEAMKVIWDDYGFDLVEVTRYDDDPNQINVVGYKYGNVYPDQYIILGGHFDVGYAFTPPGGGTTEGANDDTSGSTVSMEVAQAIAAREWDHTVVAALWAFVGE